ncbi:MAG TPA: tryptophan 7-halogenase, partial [Thermoanaerobaculia bacterium]|nr:tryptophan 7-halogenase [Thermoanaerobaculia bacterium]
MHVKPADLLLDGKKVTPSPLAQATMHHIFDGGWIWVIPFSNHRTSTNPLTSVGLMLDRRKYPTPHPNPEEEFRSLIARFPTIQRHFADAVPVRPWFSTGRIQYSQRQLVGPRWLQLPHAALFVDPLFSSGMSVLTVCVDLIGETLLRAFADNDFDVERFRRIEETAINAMDHFDLVVSTSFDSFASYDLWNAWNRNWVMGNFLGTFGPFANLIRFLGSGDRSFLARTTEPGRLGVLSNHLPEVRGAMLASADDIRSAIDGRVSHRDAGQRIFERLGALDFLPKYMGFGKPEQHAPSVFTLPMGARHVMWYRFLADRKWRDYATFSLLTYARHAGAFTMRQAGDAARRFSEAVRDVWFAGNDEWKTMPHALSAHGRVHELADYQFAPPELGEPLEAPAIQHAK